MFVGVCVLIAITFVLSRSPQSGSSGNVAVIGGGSSNTNANAVHGSAVATVPEGTATVQQYYESPVSNNVMAPAPTNNAATATDDNGPVIQISPPVKTMIGGTSSSSTITTADTSSSCDCNGKVDPSEIDIGALRAAALASTPPHIIECSAASDGESQSACHLPSSTRFAALKQKGATLWMTGCSGAGKTTIATALEDRLVKAYGKHVYRLDGDNLRTGINRDLTFSEADRAESVRRTGEIATLFADAGVITLVGLISPYREDRDMVRKRHEDQGIPFYEIFLDVPVEELKKRDPKGQYARVESGELRHFTCIDDPYEPPLHPEITLKTHELEIEQSADILFRRLEMDGILVGAPKLAPPGLPNPDGDEIIDLHTPEHLRSTRRLEAETLPKVLITDLDLNWLQVIGEGWAAPLKGFMREGTLLEVLHFNSILVDPFNLTSNGDIHTSTTNFENFNDVRPPDRVSMSVPITLSCTAYTKSAIESSSADAVALTTQMGNIVAILRNPEIYPNRKEEIVTRMFGVIDPGHPYIQQIYKGGDYLIGGEVELLDRIRYNDGLDEWRKTASEIMEEFKQKGADTVYAFQTRNPTHSGHAYLMRSAGENLKKQGFKKPVLWLSPLGGWTKEDDVPLDVRVKQHAEVLNSG
jgi:3'-phosphoadenosine 5'-phosphosulfate synthase